MSNQGPGRKLGPHLNGKARRILVLQQNLSEAVQTAECIQGFGHVVACLTNLPEAIDLVCTDSFDMVVLEWPHGREIVKLLAQFEPFRPKPKVVLLTCPPTLEQVLEADHNGGDVVLAKPVVADNWAYFLKAL